MLPATPKKASHSDALMTIITPTYRKTITKQMIEQLLIRLIQAG